MRTNLIAWTQRLLHNSTGLRRARKAAACLTISLATAWSGSAEAAVVHLEVAPTADLTQAFVIYNNYVVNTSFAISVHALGNLPGGQTTVFDHDVPEWTNEMVQGGGSGYMFFALHGPPGEQGVSLSFPDDSLVTSNGSWDSFIASTCGPNGYYPEQEIVDTWQENWATTLGLSFPDRIHLPFGATATIVNMSDAVNGGIVNASVPEPATWILLAAGAGVLAVRTRRRDG